DWQWLVEGGESTFVGYDNHRASTRVVKFARQGDQLLVVPESTPFYAESGGQVGDTGTLSGDGWELAVTDTQKIDGEHVCFCPAKTQPDFKGDITATVDAARRARITYNHTATHLLHAALREALGDHIRQAGSLVAPDYLRFDFTHFKKIEPEELTAIEKRVNQKIRENLPVDYFNTDFNTAKAAGAMALFGEKYGDVVRVVNIAPYSMELCGGCHVRNTGEIGAFMIASESSTASGIRRIEAYTGIRSEETMRHQRELLGQISALLNTPAEHLSGRITEMLQHQKELEKHLQQLQAGEVLGQVDELLSKAEDLGSVKLIIAEFQDSEVDILKQAADELRMKSSATVGFLVNHSSDKLNFVCMVSDDLVKSKTVAAGDLVREAAKIAGGGGGGKPHLATAGARDAAKLPEVYAFLRKTLGA
ncbi:MAG TPA: DHHA1 domain-containing protein, partial [Calditrichia bacterium]|nr:DHHA1 domain-containing protein [Calditrichia bacterium]